MTMDRLAIAGAIALLTFTGCTSGPKPAQPVTTTETKRSGDTVEMTETITLQAKVVSVNQKTRMVVLQGPDGGKVEFRADDQVKNLPQVRKGDMITAVYRRAIAAKLVKKGSAKVGTESADVLATAKPGEKPAAVDAQAVQITARVTKVNRETKEVTLKGPKGRSVTVAVKDPKVMEDVKVGDLVEVTYTEALIVAVEAPAK